MSGDSSDDVIESRLAGDVRSGAPHRGGRSLTAILPSGRIVWLRVDPALAPVRALGHLGQLAEHTARWRRASLQSQRDAIVRLSDATAADTERTVDTQVTRAQAMRRRIVASDRTLDRTLAKAREEHRSRGERQRRIERETVERLGRRDLWDTLVLLTSLPLFVAYGERGRPFGANNVALLLSLLVWLVGDEIVDALFGSEDKSPYPLRDTDSWSYLAPIGNLLAGWWLLDDRQNERFIAGRAAFPVNQFESEANPSDPLELLYRYAVEIDLVKVVALGHRDDFKTFTGVPAVATISSITFSDAGTVADARIAGLIAKVNEGTLSILFTAAAKNGPGPVQSVLSALEVAWMFDTQEPSTHTSTM